MSETIIVAIITAAAAVVPSLIGIIANNKVIETKIETLTREVREHNEFARRVPVLETKVEAIEKRIDK